MMWHFGVHDYIQHLVCNNIQRDLQSRVHSFIQPFIAIVYQTHLEEVPCILNQFTLLVLMALTDAPAFYTVSYIA